MNQECRRIVIIGGVAAGLKAAARLHRLEPQTPITVIDRGEEVSYGACALPYYIAGLFPDLDEVRRTPAGVLRDEAFFRRVKGVEVRTGTEAVRIDREAKTVELLEVATGERTTLRYAKLVLATGNRPILPSLPGIDLSGVVALKSMGDAATIDRLARQGKSAVIVGGGLIGLEMAEALRERGLRVTLLEKQGQILPATLDAGMAALVQRELTRNGVELRLGEALLRLEGEEGRVRRAVTATESYPADLVLVAIGVHPETTLARKAGLEIGPTGAIAVDTGMRTSDPDIYAAGDCSEATNLLTGRKVYVPLGSTANKQGRVAADNLAGRPAEFAGILGSLIVKVFDLSVARTGLSHAEAREHGFEPETILAPAPDRAHLYPGAKPIVVKLIADRPSRRLLGAQIVGPGDVGKRIDVVATALSFGATIDQLAQLDLAYAPPFSSAMDPLHQAANALRNKLDGIGQSIDPLAVEALRKQGRDLLLLDVRSAQENAEVRIPGATLIPLGLLRERLEELPPEREIVPFCKLSLRGYEAQRILQAAGFRHVRYLEGGILGWPFDLESGA